MQKRTRLATRATLRGHFFLPDSSPLCPELGDKGHEKRGAGPHSRMEPAQTWSASSQWVRTLREKAGLGI